MKNKLTKRNQSGFTLVEIIVVIVILAVLSATLLPRFLNQTERAVIAEAQSTLGALRRGQNLRADTVGAGAFLTVPAFTAALGQQLGLIGNPNTASWGFSCTAGAPAAPATFDGFGNQLTPAIPAIPATCIGTRVGGGNFAGSTVSMDLNTGNYACAGAYQLALATEPRRGCSI